MTVVFFVLVFVFFIRFMYDSMSVKTYLVPATLHKRLSLTSVPCVPERPCSYNDKVEFRVIVMTYNRPWSLATILGSLRTLEMDSHTAALEIWIDRDRKKNSADSQTLKIASEFRWSQGATRVHVHKKHVGLYGQWIYTWRPPDDSDDELALIIEDDNSVSKYAYRWVRAAFQAFSSRPYFAGAALSGHQVFILYRHMVGKPLVGPKNHTVMMYKTFWTWGFSPKPLHWRRFQVQQLYLTFYV